MDDMNGRSTVRERLIFVKDSIIMQKEPQFMEPDGCSYHQHNIHYFKISKEKQVSNSHIHNLKQKTNAETISLK